MSNADLFHQLDHIRFFEDVVFAVGFFEFDRAGFDFASERALGNFEDLRGLLQTDGIWTAKKIWRIGDIDLKNRFDGYDGDEVVKIAILWQKPPKLGLY